MLTGMIFCSEARFTHTHALSLSGGNEGTRYYMSVGYDDTQSTAIKNYSRRFDVC